MFLYIIMFIAFHVFCEKFFFFWKKVFCESFSYPFMILSSHARCLITRQLSQLVIYSHLHNTYTCINIKYWEFETREKLYQFLWWAAASVIYLLWAFYINYGILDLFHIFSSIWNQSLEIQFKNNMFYQRRFESATQRTNLLVLPPNLWLLLLLFYLNKIWILLFFYLHKI